MPPLTRLVTIVGHKVVNVQCTCRGLRDFGAECHSERQILAPKFDPFSCFFYVEGTEGELELRGTQNGTYGLHTTFIDAK